MSNMQCFSDNCECNVISEAGSVNPAITMSFRPRGVLARAVYQKHRRDELLNQFDKQEWYQCDLDDLPSSISSKFIQLNPDKDTIIFLEESERKSDWLFTQIWHSLVKFVLGWFMTQTSINGWLQRGSMFVVSQPQLRKLFRVNSEWKTESLLDLGAGDGKVTEHIAPMFEKVYATEMSNTMKVLLERKGYEVLGIDEWYNNEKKYDVISCLNLLDRCNTPLDLLEQMRTSLKPDGRVLLALVLPFSAYVESGSRDHKPSQLLPITGRYFEQQVQSFVEDVLSPAGFEVVSWSRVPYLCEGDLQQSYYWLDDSIFVLKLKDS